MAMTPAMVVVLTAPRPTSRTPSLPCAGAISTGVDTGEKLYHQRLDALCFRGKSRPIHARRRHDGREDGRSHRADRLRARRTPRRHRGEGRAVGTRRRRSCPTTRRRRARARARPNAGRARRSGDRAADSRCRADDGAFDVAVVDDTGGLLGDDERRRSASRRFAKRPRPASRAAACSSIGAAAAQRPRRPARPRAQSGPPFDRRNPSLEADGFTSVRHARRARGTAVRRRDQETRRNVDRLNRNPDRQFLNSDLAQAGQVPAAVDRNRLSGHPAASSDARNRISAATSSGWPGRPSGWVSFDRSRNAAYCVSSMPPRR